MENVLGSIQIAYEGWSDPIDEYHKEPSGDYASICNSQTIMPAPTYIQGLKQYWTKPNCNPVSVGQPRDNPKTASTVVNYNKIPFYYA